MQNNGSTPNLLNVLLRALLLTLRPHQWVKNLFVAAPLVFSKNLFAGSQLGRAALGVLAFCLLSGAVYILNDLADVEQDRAHPRKRRRPIASGQLPAGAARVAAVVLVAVGLALACALSWGFLAAFAGYFVLNLAYTNWLKRIPFVDVLAIAVMFLLRVLAGTFVIHVEASPWLLACTGLLACYLGFGKRAHELATSGAAATSRRAVLAGYRIAHLRVALWVLAACTIFAYALYARAPHTVAFFGTSHMILTTPFIVVGVGRFLFLVGNRPDAESPTEEMLRDKVFLANFVAWVIAVLAVIYGASV
ncbi:MAG TPA: decaprenyl-phosphate phosphoribosyltransferase [Polyangia bacterium]|jgi:4-hydroxybenzoate polyprenyltransferase